MHAGAAAREKAADGRVFAGRREQLDAPVANHHGRGLDALVGHRGAVLERGAEQALVGRQRFVEVGDGDAEVMDAASDHEADAIRRDVCAYGRIVTLGLLVGRGQHADRAHRFRCPRLQAPARRTA